MKHPILSLVALTALLAPPFSATAQVVVNGAALPAKVWHITAMPGEEIAISVDPGTMAYVGNQKLSGSWIAPRESGTHTLSVKTENGDTLSTATIFVLTPSSAISEKGYIGTYRIGKYPRNTPKGFIKLEEEDMREPVSPNFTVGQFICKQQPGVWPKYLIVSSDNLERLETLLVDLNEKRDTEADTLFVMSGYRTPFYNTAIGSAKFSRHMYGDAADVYVDTKPRNGNMDDLNRDGKITKADANFMYDYSQALFKEKNLIEGGLGSYKANSVHGPFIHIDARGSAARWGR